MTALQTILTAYRNTSQTERGKGTYFEELIRTYFRNRLLRLTADSPDLLAIIKQEGKV